MTGSSNQTAEKEKKSAALTSVAAAVVLTTMKIVVGVITGSLGILAEAAHSALDLVAALVTYIAVSISDKPADENHKYGHGKVENLSALFETFLLLITCVWIIYESIQRLFFKATHVDASIWAFIIMVISIALDYSRSRILSKAAEKYSSQALEADALHFSTDIWSSAVVILGLAFVKFSELFPAYSMLQKADAIAALGVAIIVIYVSIKLGLKTISALLDETPAGMEKKIKEQVEKINDICDCHNIRMRYSGATLFIDVHVLMDGDQPLKIAHDITEKIEKAIQEIYPGCDVTVHPEPIPTDPEKKD